MSVSWEIDLLYARDNRDPEADSDLEPTHYHGRPVYRKTVEADSYEQGSSGTLAMYYRGEEDDGLLKESKSNRDPDLIAVEATRIGEPDTPDEDEIPETAEEWEQSKQ